MQKIAIIIPCYNEELRLDFDKVTTFLQQSNISVYFANDGSTDKTAELALEFIKHNSSNCFLINYKKNVGKANVIYKSIQTISGYNKYDAVAYFDADFSTPASEMTRLINEQEKTNADFVLASRVLLLNSGIKRKKLRHYIGRFILTFINIKFDLAIYDTQCGAKVFSKRVIPIAFSKPFFTSWLFDVEILIRLKQQNLIKNGKEITITNWKDVEGSKLSWKSGFKILRELYLIYTKY